MPHTMLHMKILITDYQYPFGCTVISALSLVIFFILGVNLNPEWFSRGGSIIVLFAIAAEYGLVITQSAEMEKRGKSPGTWDAPSLTFKMPAPFSKLRMSAHLLAIIGTLIWGFGDWFIEHLLKTT